jgi:hypothetical protein
MMFTYSYNGHFVTRESMVYEFGDRKVREVFEVIAAGHGSYKSGAFLVVPLDRFDSTRGAV